jgi:hypothetical protein
MNFMDINQALLDINKSFYVEDVLTHYPLSKIADHNTDGLSVLLFGEESEIFDFFPSLQIKDGNNHEIKRIGSAYDKMMDFSDLGFVGFIKSDGVSVNFATRKSEYNISLPSLGYILDPQNCDRLFFGASGPLGNYQSFNNWNNYHKSDKLIRKFISFETGFQIDPEENFYSIINSNSNEYIKTENGSPLHGNYSFGESSYSVFSKYDYAKDYLLSLQLSVDFEIVNINDLNEFLTEQFVPEYYLFRFYIGLNPGAPRSEQGYFFGKTNKWILRNVFGYFYINGNNEISDLPEEEIIIFQEDSVDKSVSVDPAEFNLHTTTKFPLKRITGSTKNSLSVDEATEVVDNEIENSYYAENEDWGKDIELKVTCPQ